MPQSLSKILIHVTFSTKGRQPVLAPIVNGELCRYLAGTFMNIDCPPTIVGGYLDHVHILCTLSKTLSVSKMIETVKSSSSRWLKTKEGMPKDFAWQNGYGAFSVSQSGEADVKRYIEKQEEHHKTRTFQEELRTLLDKYKIKYDEKYLWD